MDMPVAILIHRSEAGHTGAEVDAAEARQKCGYHYFIRKDGTIDVMHAWGEKVNHALRWSRCTISIAVYGDFDPVEGSVNSTPTREQWNSLLKLCLVQYNRWGAIPILGHTDLPGATAYPDKRCPGPALNVRALQVAVLDTFIAHRDAEPPTA